MTVYEFAGEIKSKADFDKFLEMFHEEFTTKGKDWENNTLPLFLETMSRYS